MIAKLEVCSGDQRQNAILMIRQARSCTFQHDNARYSAGYGPKSDSRSMFTVQMASLDPRASRKPKRGHLTSLLDGWHKPCTQAAHKSAQANVAS